MSDEIARILADRPFRSYCHIADVKPLTAENAVSGATFFIETDKGRFKLRCCKDERQAKEYEENIRRFVDKLPHKFPTFYGRDGRYLLVQALDGYRQLTKEEMRRNAREIGRVCAQISDIEDASKHDAREWYMSRLRSLRDRAVVDEVLFRNAEALYDRLLARTQVRIAYQIHDIHEGNMMIGPSGDILYVDEDGLGVRVEGQGIGKVLKRLNYEEYEEFKRGYGEIKDHSFLTPEYEQHLALVEAVSSLYFKTLKGRALDEARKDLETLKRMAA